MKPTADADLLSEANDIVAGTLFDAIYAGEPTSRRIAGSEHFAVLADIAPLVEGHVLVVPRIHLPSLGAMPSDWWAEFDGLLERVRAALASAFEPASLFEHGSSSRGAGSSCVNYAHLHLLPCATSLPADLRSRGIAVDAIHSMRALSHPATADHPYLFCATPDDELHLADLHSGPEIPRQYIRRRIADELGIQNWDWGVPQNPAALRTTVTRLRAELRR